MKKFPNNLISFYRTDRLILIIYPSLLFQKKEKEEKEETLVKFHQVATPNSIGVK